MTPPKSFTIDKVSWHTQVQENPEPPEDVKRRFRIIVDFLQQEGLVRRELLGAGISPSCDFAIGSADLTDEGLAVMKAGYDKWLKKIVNKRKDIADVSILKECLAKIRGDAQ